MRSTLILMLLLAACRPPSAEETRAEAASLRASLERHRGQYLKSIEAENLLVRETLAWLNGGLESRNRGLLRSEAGRFMEKWARVYFVPREMHAAIRESRFRSETVREAHQRVLDHLKKRYFELHDFQRYAQYTNEAAESSMPLGRMPDRLAEFRTRLEGRPDARDEITGALETLGL